MPQLLDPHRDCVGFPCLSRCALGPMIPTSTSNKTLDRGLVPEVAARNRTCRRSLVPGTKLPFVILYVATKALPSLTLAYLIL